MASIKEILEQKFEDYKSGKLNEDNFFHDLWQNALLIAPAERRPLFERVFDYVQQHSAAESTANALATFTMGNLAFHEEKYELSLSLTAEADKLFQNLNDPDGLALCNMGYGGVYRTLGDFNLALKYLLEAYDQLSKSHKYITFELASSYALAGVYVETKNFDKAIEHYLRTAEITKNDNKPFYQLAIDGLGVIYEQKGEWDKAMEYFREALAVCEEIDNPVFKSRVLSDIAHLYVSKKEYDKAIEYNTTALNIREQYNIPGGANTNLIQLAQLYLREKKYADAANYMNRALEKAEAIKVKPKIMQVHQLFAELYESSGDLEKSLEHYKTYHALSEEVNKEDGINKVKRAEMIFEAEQTKKENAIIRAQKKEIERKNIELQNTINELTITKISRKAKTLTLVIAVVLLLAEEPITGFVQEHVGAVNEYLALGTKILVVLLLKPIEDAIEHFMLKKTVLKKPAPQMVRA